MKNNQVQTGETTGGPVQVVLELELENAAMNSHIATLRFQETEQDHGFAKNHFDWALDLTRATDWQQWLDPDGTGPQEAG